MKYIPFKGPGFTLQRPQAWSVSASLDYQTMFVGDVNAWGVRPNILLAIRPIQDDVTLAQVLEHASALSQQELAGYTILQELDQSPAGWVERRYGWVRQEDDLGIVQLQRFYKVDNLLFVFTGTRTEHEPHYDEVFYHILESFALNSSHNN